MKYRANTILLVFISVLTTLGGCRTADGVFVSTTEFNHSAKRRHAEPSVTISFEDDRFEMKSAYVPGITVSGIVDRRTARAAILYVDGARLFANWENGWTEAVYQASGVIELNAVSGRRYDVTVTDPIEFWTLTRGEIRYYDTYVLGDEGISKTKARIDRLEALAEWLRGVSGRPVYGDADEGGTYGAALTTALWTYVDTALTATDTAERGRLDAAAFGTGSSDPPPQWLVDLHASGTIERDVREAADLLVALYNLSLLNETLLDAMILEEDTWN